jgi:hypothetical protein
MYPETIKTRADFARFEEAFRVGTKGLTHLSSGTLGPSNGPDQCPDCETDSEEPFFSKSSCDICNRSMAGDRYIAHGIMQKGGFLIHLEVCPDCLYYMTYDALDDETMERVEESDNIL